MKRLKRASALKYGSGYEAPVVTAQGAGITAEKIIQKAEETDVPVVFNKELSDLLFNVDVGESIPAELYSAVAEILAYIMEIDKKVKRR
jgi:flagellar biosynthesis protein